MTEQTIEEMSAEIDDEVALERSEVAKLLPRYASSRDAEAVYRKDKDAMGDQIKRWLLREGGELVEEGADGTYVAHLQERRLPGRPCDLNALWDQDKRLFEQLIRNGCLRVDDAAVKRAGALVAMVEQYMGPYGSTVALVVEKK